MIKNKIVNRAFDDLDAYRAFCVEFGYVFNEADLYRRHTVYGLYEKHKRGEWVQNNWKEDAYKLPEVSVTVQ